MPGPQRPPGPQTPPPPEPQQLPPGTADTCADDAPSTLIGPQLPSPSEDRQQDKPDSQPSQEAMLCQNPVASENALQSQNAEISHNAVVREEEMSRDSDWDLDIDDIDAQLDMALERQTVSVRLTATDGRGNLINTVRSLCQLSIKTICFDLQKATVSCLKLEVLKFCVQKCQQLPV